MRLNLATSLKTRTGSLNADAKLLNCFVEEKAGVKRVVKRPSLFSTYEVTAGTGQLLTSFTTTDVPGIPGTPTLVVITNDVLNNRPNEVAKSNAYFVQPPASTGPATAMSPAIVVRVLGRSGIVAAGYTGNITLSLGANPAGGTLSGTLTVACVAGVATFSNVKIDKIGTGYTLVATATI